MATKTGAAATISRVQIKRAGFVQTFRSLDWGVGRELESGTCKLVLGYLWGGLKAKLGGLKPQRILLLMDNRGDANWGSQATTNGLVSLLKERFPDATLTGLPRNVAKPNGHARKWTEKWAPEVMRSGKYDSIKGKWVMRKLTASWEKEYESADLVVVNGEGTLHPQRQTRRWLPVLDYLHKKHRKPLWVVNSTIAYKDHEDAWQFQQVLRHADRLVVRDEYSHRELAADGIESTLAADCAYVSEPATEETSREILAKVGVTGEFAVFTGSATIKHWPLDVQKQIVEKLRSVGLQVVYTSSNREDDEVVRQLGSIPLITHREVDFRELMAIQGLARILVGGRYHPTILAALMGTPFVAFTSNTFKMPALMEVLKSEELLIQSGDLGRTLAMIDKVLDEREVYGYRLKESARAQAPLARRNVFD